MVDMFYFVGYHNVLVGCHFARYRSPWVTVVVTLVGVWLLGVMVVLIIVVLIWRLAKKENTAGACNLPLNIYRKCCRVLFN